MFRITSVDDWVIVEQICNFTILCKEGRKKESWFSKTLFQNWGRKVERQLRVPRPRDPVQHQWWDNMERPWRWCHGNGQGDIGYQVSFSKGKIVMRNIIWWNITTWPSHLYLSFPQVSGRTPFKQARECSSVRRYFSAKLAFVETLSTNRWYLCQCFVSRHWASVWVLEVSLWRKIEFSCSSVLTI